MLLEFSSESNPALVSREVESFVIEVKGHTAQTTKLPACDVTFKRNRC